MYSFLSVGWGFIADIDIESERLRSIGYQRFTVWSVHRLISLRTYHGKVSYLPVQSDILNEIQQQQQQQQASNNSIESNNSNNQKSNTLKHSISLNMALDCPECHGNGDCEVCDIDFGDVLSLENASNGGDNASSGGVGGGSDLFRPRIDSWYSATSKRSAYFSTTESVYQSIIGKESNTDSIKTDTNSVVQTFGPASNLPSLTIPVPDNWICEEGEFIMVHAAYQSHLGTDCYFAPSSKLNDGIIWLLIIRGGATRSQLLTFLLGLSTGTHIPTDNENIQMIPVTAFRIEPTSTGIYGNMTVDGECVEYGPIQGEIFNGLANVMVPQFS